MFTFDLHCKDVEKVRMKLCHGKSLCCLVLRISDLHDEIFRHLAKKPTPSQRVNFSYVHRRPEDEIYIYPDFWNNYDLLELFICERLPGFEEVAASSLRWRLGVFQDRRSLRMFLFSL